MTDRGRALLGVLEATKLVCVIRIKSKESLVPVMEALYKGGVKIIEITSTTPDFEQQIHAIRYAFRQRPDCFVGAGTILSTQQADLAFKAGADFFVSPVFDEEVFAHCKFLGLPTMPGCMTPSESYRAWKAGADVVKAFPGMVCTPQWFADIRGPLPMIPMMPTGNVNEITALQYIKAGAIAVGVGKALANEEEIIAHDWISIEQHARLYSSLVSKS